MAVIIILQRACNSTTVIEKPGTTTVHTDTSWKIKDTTIVKKVPFLKRDTVYRPGDLVFIPDTSYEKLKLQFASLVKEYTVRNIYQDTFYLDSLGKIVLTDTVQYNKLQQRKFNLSYKIPVVTNTITHYQAPSRQFYLGAGVSMTQTFQNPTVQVGLLYKTKKDHLFGAYTLLQSPSPQIGLSSYWKISLKK